MFLTDMNDFIGDIERIVKVIMFFNQSPGGVP